ncbi:aldose 1-epimerase family protein [Flavobacterium phycosphaerae]|uniref:aldose 1-epimerase family protein n=1 Tax=Flavobacterium phycosphaerae TaxID=2697515 RepID=UPI00138AEC0B|nr:aldose 1-epimerase family protein [Flavobacterium phycosphaerae]
MITTISNSILSVTIDSKGAELQSLQNVSSKREYIWEGNPEYWGKHSPVLFPIVGTLKNNSYHYQNKSYKLSRHGFARDMDFKLISSENNKVVFSLQCNEATKQAFPFEFELLVTYLLVDAELTITYTVINQGKGVMPYSIGGHPAFALNDSFEKYSLQFETDEKLLSYALENDLLSENKREIQLNTGRLPLAYSLFERDALIFKSLSSKQIQIFENEVPLLNFKFSGFPNFGIWTKKNAPFICLEPWAGYSDTLAASGNIIEKEGIQLLAGKSSQEYRFSIEII